MSELESFAIIRFTMLQYMSIYDILIKKQVEGLL